MKYKCDTSNLKHYFIAIFIKIYKLYPLSSIFIGARLRTNEQTIVFRQRMSTMLESVKKDECLCIFSAMKSTN